MSLTRRLGLRTAIVSLLVMAMLFAPAGSFRFWPAWVFLGQFLIFNLFFTAYFLRRNPEFVERRLRNREERTEQKRFKVLWVLLWTAVLVLPGFDYRFGWSRVPVEVSVAAQAVVAVAWVLIFQVFRANSFAAATVRVEEGQKVITTGPYALVRHPMYSGLLLMIGAIGFAIGSYIAVVPALLKIPLLIYRLKDEERVLRKELPGYAGYCEVTRFRLVPGVW
jgi:protein-S-isoprenylcysteine O-methyltransferase Ste14